MGYTLLVMLVAVLAIVSIVVAVRMYTDPFKRLFSPAHHREVAAEVLRLRESARRRLEEPPKAGADAQAADHFVTSVRLALSYSIGPEAEGFKHHFAVSLVGRPTPHAVGDRFLYYIAHWSALPTDRVAFFSTQSTVHHGEVTLTTAEQRQVPAQHRGIPTDVELSALEKNFLRKRIACKVVTVPRAV